MLWAAETGYQIGKFKDCDAVCTISEVLFGEFIPLEFNNLTIQTENMVRHCQQNWLFAYNDFMSVFIDN